jgi:hypothetical protein
VSAVRLLTPLSRYWLAPAPPERLAAVRILVGGFAVVYLLARWSHLTSYGRFDAGQFAPVGIVGLLARPWPAPAVLAVAALGLVLGVAFTLGRHYRLSGPGFALALLWTITYRNSWGMIFHTENLLVLHVAVLGLCRAADAWSLDARRAAPATGDLRHYGWPLRLMSWVVVAAYLLAGIAKLRHGGAGWIHGEVLRNYVAADNLRKILLGSFHSPLAPLAVRHDWMFTALAVFTMLFELGAPLALTGPWPRRLWVASAIAFHWGVLALMMIAFPYPMTGVAFVCMGPAERWVERCAGRLRRRRDGS